MNIVILDDYQDAVRKLDCAVKLENFPAKVYTNTVKGIGQLSVRLKDADIIVLIRERTQLTRAVIEKLPRLKLIAQTGRLGGHVDLAACTERGVAVAEGVGFAVTGWLQLVFAAMLAVAPGATHAVAGDAADAVQWKLTVAAGPAFPLGRAAARWAQILNDARIGNATTKVFPGATLARQLP